MAQDLHFSQYELVPTQLNPALTASDPDWDTRLGLVYRDQWRSVPVTYQTAQLFYDRKLDLAFLPQGEWGLGATFLHDQAGDGQLSWSQLGLRLSYGVALNQQHRIALGLGTDVGQRAIRLEQLAFEDQYNGEVFDPNSLTAEQLDRSAAGFASLQAGVLYQWEDRRTEKLIQAGWSTYHLNQPLIRFQDDQGIALSMRHALHLKGSKHFTEQWETLVYAHQLFQGPYFESLLRVGARYHTTYREEALVVGANLAHRLGDAWIPQLTLQYGPWLLGLTYDFNSSAFRTATTGRGGSELVLHYYLKQVKPPDAFKSCPIF